MTGQAKINWYTDEVAVVTRQVADDMLALIAFEIIAQAKIYMTDYGFVDTGFARNSGYVILPPSSDVRNELPYSKTWISGQYKRTKGDGVYSQAVRAPKRRLPSHARAAVVFAAEYAIYLEMRQSFLHRAAQTIAGRRAEAIIKVEAKKRWPGN